MKIDPEYTAITFLWVSYPEPHLIDATLNDINTWMETHEAVLYDSIEHRKFTISVKGKCDPLMVHFALSFGRYIKTMGVRKSYFMGVKPDEHL